MPCDCGYNLIKGDSFQVIPAGTARVWNGTGDLIPDLGGSLGPGGGMGPGHRTGRYERGLWDVPRDLYPAMLHRGEMVLPADFADEYRRSGSGGGGGNTYNITLNVPPNVDRVALGRELVQAIQAYERRSGKVWRAA